MSVVKSDVQELHTNDVIVNQSTVEVPDIAQLLSKPLGDDTVQRNPSEFGKTVHVTPDYVHVQICRIAA